MRTTPSLRGRRTFAIAALAAAMPLGLLAWLGGDPAPVPGAGHASPPGMAATKGGGMDWNAQWKAVDALVEEQKMQEAADQVAVLLEAAKSAPNEEQWVRALVKATQLRISLRGYETAVRFLKDQPWPKEEVHQAVLELYFAHSLVTYQRAYSWEINRRERVESKAELDLKAWTREEIFTAALGAEVRVWAARERLGRMPVSDLAEYLEPNTYPPGIRDTLRDAVGYLLVELLADTANWRPEDSNQVFLLDLAALVKGNALATAPVKLDDPAVHPLLRICAVLDDLEAWSRAGGRREAALETRLERARRLRDSFTDKADRVVIREDLNARLVACRDLPWWAAGMAELATFVRDEEDGQALVRARSIALEGHRAYPDSVGGQRCLHLVKAIEAPDYSIQAMTVDGLARRSIMLTHRNLQTMYFRAYAVDLRQWLDRSDDWNLLPSSQDVQKIVQTQQPATSWQVPLPATPDYRSHRTFVTPDIRRLGLFVVVSSARADFGTANNELLAVPLLLSDLVVLSRPNGLGGVEVRVVSGATGEPVRGASVTLWKRDWQQGHHPVKTLTADEGGMVVFDSTGKRRDTNNFLVAEHGGDLSLEANGVWFSMPSKPELRTASLVFTDRSIYRPMQKVFWKVLAYQGVREEGQLKVATETQVVVTLHDPHGETVETARVTTNAYGTASGEFVLPTGRLLGGWQVRTSLDGAQAIRVEEYKRPTFEASFKEPTEPMRLNKPARLVGEVRYYFGLPVTSGSVRYRVTREPVYPWWWGWWWGGPTVGSQQIAAGAAALSEEGTFEVAFTPQADERLAQTSQETTYRFTVSADVTDEGGETRSATRAVRLGFVAVEASIDLPGGFVREGAGAEVPIRRTSLDGAPRPGNGEWRLVELVQPATSLMPAEELVPMGAGGEPGDTIRTPGDAQRPRWETGWVPERALRGWAAGRELGQGRLSHDARGVATATLPKLSSGAYRIVYTTQDEFGARYETAKELVVGGTRTKLQLPLLLRAEESMVKVGGTARLLVCSGLPGQVVYLDLFRGGKVAKRQRLVAGTDATVVEIPVGEQDRGGFGVTASMERDHQLLSFTQAIHVPWDNKQLEVSFASFRDKLRPGAHETWRVTVKGAGAEVGAGELLAYMYDKSLDVFAPHRPASVLWLYPSRMGTTPLRANLSNASGMYFVPSSFDSPPPWPTLQGDRLRFYASYGIGGPGGRGIGAGVPPPAPMMQRASRPMATLGAVADEDSVAEAESAGGARKKNGESKDKGAAAAAEPEATAAATSPPAELRSNFAETAFWQPHLVTDAQGGAAVELTVPDSVTAWNVWVHAVTRDLKGGSLQKEARSVKDLMVRPYVPRFLREGDVAEVKVVVNNAAEQDLQGQLDFDIQDPETNASLLADFGLAAAEASRPFAVKAGGGTNLSFKVTAPRRVGTVAFKVVARSGEDSDGELRPLPVLPSRMHLAQSRFVTLRNADHKVMRFEDLAAGGDPTLVNEQMVVTVDAQLFYQVLAALPYLVNYPYECTEQTLNRFLSTGIVSSVYQDYPAVARMAEQMAKRETVLETFDDADPNRRMTLEETPWLIQARGGKDAGEGFVNVLDPRMAKANREQSLAKLKKAQTSSGAFPWWPGGPPSPFMTLYIAHGFAKAVEFGVEVPKDMVVRAWGYLARYFRDDLRRMMAEDCCWEFLTFLNYVASSYPDESWTGGALTLEERKEILAFSFKHWKEHSPYLKSYLALTLKRMGREADARLVWASVMDSAKTTPEDGTFWAQEDRSWLWYKDRIETHALALRTLTEMEPQDSRRDGLVQWLLLNKKLNQWKSTRATAEVIYSLVRYLKAEGALGIPEDATVTVGHEKVTFTFDPEKYTGKKNQVVLPGEKVGPDTATVTVEKTSKGFAFASATWQFSTEKLPEAERGDFFQVSRKYFKRENVGREWVLKPLAEGAAIAVGDQLEVQISLRTRHEAEYVHLRDPRGAGFEPESPVSRFKWDLGLGYYEEVRDSGANFFFEQLPVGEYTFKYRLRANMAGTFRVGPATVQSMYAPEFNAYSAGNVLTVTP